MAPAVGIPGLGIGECPVPKLENQMAPGVVPLRIAVVSDSGGMA